MKKEFTTRAAIFCAAMLISVSLFGQTKAPVEVRRVTVKGNASVTLIQGNNFWVAVDNEEDQQKVSIKQVGDELVINATASSPIAVKVHVKELFRIVASNNARVKTLGKLDQKYLQVLLSDDALVKVRTNTEALYTEIRGHARLELLGATNRHILKSAAGANLKMEKFAVLATEYIPSKDSSIVVNRELAH